MTEDQVTIPCDDISLEGVLRKPEGEGSFPAVVVCHPHPQFGGSMDNNVVYAVCYALAQSSIAWMKFNFRGVGRSGGRFGNGIGEMDDVVAAVSFISTMPGIDKDRIGLCGYSFGAGVAAQVVSAEQGIKALALVSPMVSALGALAGYPGPKLVVCGAADEFANPSGLQRICEILPQPLECRIVPQADHFWVEHEGEVGEMVADLFTRYLK